MKKNPAISIIVPIYNAELFLERCINSILKQTFQDFELLLINDGSEDSSLNIAKEYSDKYIDKIRVYTHKNIGCSATRNVGLRKAKGEYILFLDSDDWIDSTMLEEMYSLAKEENSDIVLSGMIFENRRENFVEIRNPTSKEWFSDKNLISFVSSKLHKTEIIKENNILFQEDIKLAEDFIFNIEVLVKSNKISILKKASYHYIIHSSNSIFNIENRRDIFKALDRIYDILNRNSFLEIEKNTIQMEKIFTKHLKASFTRLLKIEKYSKFRLYYKEFFNKVRYIEYLKSQEKFSIYIRAILVYFIYLFQIQKIILLKNRILNFLEMRGK